MPRRPALAIVPMLAMLLIFTGCTPAPAPRPSPTVALSTPEPSPTAEALVVAPGELPPTIFDGDCGLAISPAALSEITGVPDIELIRRDTKWTTSIDNVGGLACEWEADGVTGSFQVLPSQMLGETVFSEWEQSHVGECDWLCSWVVDADPLWIGGYASDLPERGRVEADRMGAAISAHIAGQMRPADLEWVRDQSGWWPAASCDALAAAVGDRLDTTVSATTADYHDPPLPATRMADAAAKRTWCAFEESGTTFAHSVAESGMAWSVPWAGFGTPHDLGVASIDEYLMSSGGYLGGTSFAMTDGVNSLTVEVAPDTRWTADQVATVFAELAASELG